MAAQRKSIDCRNYPSENNCSLKISGTEEEVLDTAVQYAAFVHGTRTRRSCASKSSRCSRTSATERSCRRWRSALSDSRPLRLCFYVQFCKELARDTGEFAGPRNTHDHWREV